MVWVAGQLVIPKYVLTFSVLRFPQDRKGRRFPQDGSSQVSMIYRCDFSNLNPSYSFWKVQPSFFSAVLRKSLWCFFKDSTIAFKQTKWGKLIGRRSRSFVFTFKSVKKIGLLVWDTKTSQLHRQFSGFLAFIPKPQMKSYENKIQTSYQEMQTIQKQEPIENNLSIHV